VTPKQIRCGMGSKKRFTRRRRKKKRIRRELTIHRCRSIILFQNTVKGASAAPGGGAAKKENVREVTPGPGCGGKNFIHAGRRH